MGSRLAYSAVVAATKAGREDDGEENENDGEKNNQNNS